MVWERIMGLRDMRAENALRGILQIPNRAKYKGVAIVQSAHLPNYSIPDCGARKGAQGRRIHILLPCEREYP